MKHENIVLPRTGSCKCTNKIIPSALMRSSSFVPRSENPSDCLLVCRGSSPISVRRLSRTGHGITTILKSLLNLIALPTIIPTCKWLSLPHLAHLSVTPSLGRKVTGTLFGFRRGHVSFAVQDDPRSQPVSIIELAVSTAALVKEMSTGLVRIALECEKGPPPARGGRRSGKLFTEPIWTMYCNGRKCGYALSRACTESDWHVLSTVRTVSVGAGVIPVVEDGGRKDGGSEGELLYMRAKFERVVGSRDSEAFYMMNPDGTGGPELSLFLLRI